MADNVYEGLFIFDANKFARDNDALPGKVQEMITGHGGEVLVSRLWEERRLAFPIKNQRKGAYWLMYFRLGSEHLTGLNRACELEDGVLRQLVLKIHPRLVEPILAHASGAGVEEEGEEGDAPESGGEAPAAEPAAPAAAE
ncbi:MAG: 30S ribosomal protein S6 [Planctomycetota bacterium]